VIAPYLGGLSDRPPSRTHFVRRSEARGQTGFVGSTSCRITAPGLLETEKSKCDGPRLIGDNSGITGKASTSVELFHTGRAFGSGTTFPFLLSSSGRVRFSSRSTISISSGVAGRSSGSLSLTTSLLFALLDLVASLPRNFCPTTALRLY
jgi:hypothetical protein